MAVACEQAKIRELSVERWSPQKMELVQRHTRLPASSLASPKQAQAPLRCAVAPSQVGIVTGAASIAFSGMAVAGGMRSPLTQPHVAPTVFSTTKRVALPATALAPPIAVGPAGAVG